jgi:hypothetical protein
MVPVKNPDAGLPSGFGILLRDRQIALPVGQTFVGRGPECQVVILGAHVSRKHAMFTATERGVVIEDLGSANGCFVNQQRITSATSLKDGDRILVGTEELSFFVGVTESDGAAVVSSGVDFDPEDATAHGRAPPAVRPVTFQPVERKIHESAAPTEPMRDPLVRPPGELKSSRVRTARRRLIETLPVARVELMPDPRADAFQRVEAAVGRMLARGDVDAAGRTLAGQVGTLLQDGRGGTPVPRGVVYRAARCCLVVAQVARERSWIDRAVELYLQARLVMEEEVLDFLEPLLDKYGMCEPRLLAEYRNVVRRQLEHAAPDELARCDRILSLRIA